MPAAPAGCSAGKGEAGEDSGQRAVLDLCPAAGTESRGPGHLLGAASWWQLEAEAACRCHPQAEGAAWRQAEGAAWRCGTQATGQGRCQAGDGAGAVQRRAHASGWFASPGGRLLACSTGGRRAPRRRRAARGRGLLLRCTRRLGLGTHGRRDQPTCGPDAAHRQPTQKQRAMAAVPGPRAASAAGGTASGGGSGAGGTGSAPCCRRRFLVCHTLLKDRTECPAGSLGLPAGGTLYAPPPRRPPHWG